MEKTFVYKPKDVCAQQIEIAYEGDKITSISFVRGCRGNTQGVAALAKGRNIDEVIALLEGIECPGSRTRKTSCPDQLAKALKQLKAEESLSR